MIYRNIESTFNDYNNKVKLMFVNKSSYKRNDSEELINNIKDYMQSSTLDNIDIATYKSILVTISNSFSLIAKDKLVYFI